MASRRRFRANANHSTFKLFERYSDRLLAYGAISQGNFDDFGDALADDVELSIRGLGPLDGNWSGRAEVVAATRKNMYELDSQQPEIEAIIRQGDSIAVLMRESGVVKSTGQAYRVRAVQWFTFSDRKIKRIDEIVASS